MPQVTLEYRLRIRNRDNSGDLLVLSSRASDTNCLLSDEDGPQGDGQRVDVFEGKSEVGAYTWNAVDRNDGGDTRTITALLADVDARNQMLSNICVAEYSRNGGAWTAFHTGYLNAIKLSDAITYTFIVGDTDRREQQAELFRFLTPAFNKVSCIIGGPVVAATPAANGGPPVRAWGPIIDYGPARFKVVATPGIYPNNDVTVLQLVSGYLPPDFSAIRTSFNVKLPLGFKVPLLSVEINRLAKPYFEWDAENRFSNPGQSIRSWGWFPGLVARLTPVAGGAVVEKSPVARPTAAKFFSGEPDTPTGEFDSMASGSNSSILVQWDFVSRPAVNTLFDVLVYPSAISDQNPLHIRGHPIDIHSALNTQEGIPDDDASKAATKTALGALFYELRIHGPMKYSEFTGMLKGSAGYATRYGADGEQEFFATRVATPSTVATVTVDDILTDE